MSVCLSVCVSDRQSVRPFCLSAFPSARLSASPYFRPSVRQTNVRLSICLSVCKSDRPSGCLSLSPSVRQYVCASVCLSVCASDDCTHIIKSVSQYERLSVRPSVRMSVSPSISRSVSQ